MRSQLKFLSILSLWVLLTTSCQQKATEPVQLATDAPESAPDSAVGSAIATTMDDWDAALNSVLVKKSATDKGDGVTEFLACFKFTNSVECSTNFGRRDEFKGVSFFSSGIFGSLGGPIIAPYLKSYISLPDGEMPVIFLSPVYTGESWIFMNSIAVMVDGEVVLSRNMKSSEIRRETGLDFVDESYQFIADQSQIDALRRISEDSNVIIRITGERGYVTVDKDDSVTFKTNIVELLRIFDLLASTLESNIPPEARAASQR